MTTRVEEQMVVEHWMTTIIDDGGIERYDDLHIDRIDKRWTSREHWLEGGIEAFCLARDLRDRLRLNVTVALAFSLVSGEGPRGLNFTTPEEFHSQLDWSSPSLYLFRPGREPWAAVSREVAMEINVNALAAAALEASGCYYMEFKQPDSAEYSRSVFLAG